MVTLQQRIDFYIESIGNIWRHRHGSSEQSKEVRFAILFNIRRIREYRSRQAAERSA